MNEEIKFTVDEIKKILEEKLEEYSGEIGYYSIANFVEDVEFKFTIAK